MSDPVQQCSDKIVYLNPTNINRSLTLPCENYQPFFLKVMHDFIAHHNLPKDLPLPQGNLKMNVCFSRILDVMIHSMGEEKREAILKELNEYTNNISR
jgi:hypothetical protein